MDPYKDVAPRHITDEPQPQPQMGVDLLPAGVREFIAADGTKVYLNADGTPYTSSFGVDPYALSDKPVVLPPGVREFTATDGTKVYLNADGTVYVPETPTDFNAIYFGGATEPTHQIAFVLLHELRYLRERAFGPDYRTTLHLDALAKELGLEDSE